MNKKTIIIFVCLIVSVLTAVVVWYQVNIASHAKTTTPTPFSIVAGTKTPAILDALHEKRLLSSVLAAKIYLYRHPEMKLQAGEYNIDPGISERQLLGQLAAGKTVSQEVSILLREGLTAKDMQIELTKQGYLLDGSFEKLARTPIKDLPPRLTAPSFIKLLPSDATLEGFLFPDTYRVFKNFTAEDLIAKMLDNFNRKLTPELRADVVASGRSLSEIVTMASMLEKEVRTEADMKMVSGLFWNRIANGQALQSCASLAYILGVNKAQYSYEDTQIESPYNTYLNRGLTPGPIGNPGMRSINAAIHPTPSDYNFFLSRPDTGETVFSRTLDEHNTAKAKYLK